MNGSCIYRYYDGLSENKTIPWSFDLIETFKHKWDWKHFLKNDSEVTFPVLKKEILCSVLDHHKRMIQLDNSLGNG